jgi:hypothetical protein
MDLSHILLTRHSEVLSLNDSPVDMFSLDFSHFLFKEDPQVFTDELGVYGDDLYELVPQLEYLAAH